MDVRRRKGASPPPPPPQARKELMSKSIDNAKVSGSKQQMKMSLKTINNAPPPPKKIERSATIAGKKRPLEPSPIVDSKASVAAAAAKAAKKATSRREELLKQLKAVEDAIARKRSKT